MRSLFEKKYADYVTIFKIPIGPNQLDPTVFYHSETGNPPKLLPGIESQISKDIEIFSSNQPQRIKGYYLVGPSTKPGSKSRNGELRVIIVLNKQIMDVDVDGLEAESIMKFAKELSNRLAIGTNRKIVYMPTVRPIDSYQNYEGIYDIGKCQWYRIPNGVTK